MTMVERTEPQSRLPYHGTIDVTAELARRRNGVDLELKW
jgi:hypothetical protein